MNRANQFEINLGWRPHMLKTGQNCYENLRVLIKRLKQKNNRIAHQFHYRPHMVSLTTLFIFVAILAVIFLVVDPAIVPVVRALPESFVAWFSFITVFATAKTYLVPALLLAFLMMLTGWQSASFRLRAQAIHTGASLASVVGAIGIGGFLINVMKRMIGRARPKHYEEFGSFAFDPFGLDSSFASFPSGHATTAGSVLFFCLIFMPKWRYLWILLASLFAASRVIVGAHYVSDVVLGLSLGILLSRLACVFFARRGLGFESDGENRFVLRARIGRGAIIQIIAHMKARFITLGKAGRKSIYQPSGNQKIDQ